MRVPSFGFIDEEELARRLGIGRGAVIEAIQRGEMPGVFRRGRSVRIFWPAVVLAAFGLDLATFAKQLGITDLPDLVAYLEGCWGYDAADDRPPEP